MLNELFNLFNELSFGILLTGEHIAEGLHGIRRGTQLRRLHAGCSQAGRPLYRMQLSLSV